MTQPVETLSDTEIQTETNTLDLTASVVTRRLPGVEIVAYGGGMMRVPHWGLIAIDLSGLELGQVPILADYESRRTGVVGHGLAEFQKIVDFADMKATG